MNCRNHALRPLLAGLFILVLASSADGATLNVPADYTTIQAAVNAAAAGDTILVQSGTYYEKVNVNKALTLRGVDSGSGLPVVDARKLGSAITLSANNCTLQDFVARNSSGSSGIRVASSYNTLSGNTATSSSTGIYLSSSSNSNTISGNNATDNYNGIHLSSSSGNTISGNNATGNSNCGIYLSYNCNSNTLSGNTATGNSGYCGIYLYSSSGNTISGNNATRNYYGIYLSHSSGNTISGNNATRNYDGIYLYSSSGNTISGNNATDNSNYGIYLYYNCNSNTISGNNATRNYYGIRLYSSSNSNTISGNNATGNTNYGILLESSSGNTIEANIATNNTNYGIDLTSSSKNNTITDNTATGSAYGICLSFSSNNNTVTGNKAFNNNEGIHLTQSSGNSITGNIATGNNNYGIYLTSSSGNIIFLNTFDNTHNAWSNGANHWNATTTQTGLNLTGLLGNIWSDYNGFDCNGDGIGDTAYLIPGGSDKDYQPIGDMPCPKKLLCISGYKKDGCTGLPLSGWRIEVNNSTQEWNTTTDANGFWRICSLENDTYTICEVPKNGWNQTSQPICHTATLAGINITYLNFTNQKMYCISGYKKDNCTGAPLPGWNITLQNATGTTSQLTGPDGKYQFCNLKPGDYTITEEAQSGYTVVNGVANPVTLNCSNITNQNFTNQKLLCISGYKLLDCGKGFTLSGWTITLKNSSYNVSTTTNDTGYYEFCGLLPGSYTLSERVTPDWSAVTSPVLSPTLLCNNNLTNQNFTNIKKFCISGYKRDDCTKAGLPDCTVTLNNSSYTVSTTTNAAGYYEFCDLIPGAYTVTETVQPGWTAKTSTILSLDLNCRFGNLTNRNFTNQKLLCINGTKTDGHTGLPLAGWTINLQNASNVSDPPVIATNTTDSSGKYSFCGLESGDYIVCERMKDGWKSVTDECIYVELECEDEVVNFENIPKLCINGSKINNCTGNGLANWTIELKDDAGAVINTTETDANGDYSFCGLEPGNYTVCELLQGGWKNVTARCIDVVLDIENSEDNNFLNDPPVCISGKKINDCTDEGISGWKIFLYDAVGNRIGDAVTDAKGRYSFCNLKQGIYYVCEEEREGWVPVRDESGSIGPSNGTSEPITCNMPWCDDSCVCVNLDCQGEVVDFRNILESLCINGSKINNCTGAGIAGWGIYLYDSTGKNIAATQTDSLGRYSFCGLAPGQYRVCEEIRSGWVPVTEINHSGASCLPESCTCDACNNCIPVILDCKNSEENDFENIPPTSIKGKVIDDCTGLGLKGWMVKLYDDKGVQLTTRTTGDDGSYTFTSSTTGGLKLTAGALYWVCEAVKDGYTPVTYHANNTSRSASQEYCVPVFLDCGETEVEDFENIPPLLISGHEFNHCTGQGLDGWTIHLKDGSGNILETTTTDDAGYYQFSGRQPGWYTVCEDSIPEGWTSFRDDPNSPAMALPDASATPADCETPKCIVVRLDSCADGADNDFENIPAFCIKGNINSTTDEALPENFQVKIENSDGSVVLSVPADANGDYSFCGLKAGTYTVCLDEPGWTADEPCVVVYLDCQDEEHDFDVYKGRNPLVPGIAQPAITLDDSRGAVDPGTIAGEPSTITESDTGGDEPPAARPTTNPEIA